MHVLLATDADWIVDEVTAALGGPDTSFTVCREGRMVASLVADLYLAQRSDAEGWLVKPLDALRLRRATKAVVAGGTFTEGVPSDDRATDEATDVVDVAEGVDESETATTPEGDSVPTG